MLCGHTFVVLLLLQQARHFMHLPRGYLPKLTKLWSHRMLEHRMFKHSVCNDCQSSGIVTCLMQIWPITTKSCWFAASYCAQHRHNVFIWEHPHQLRSKLHAGGSAVLLQIDRAALLLFISTSALLLCWAMLSCACLRSACARLLPACRL